MVTNSLSFATETHAWRVKQPRLPRRDLRVPLLRSQIGRSAPNAA